MENKRLFQKLDHLHPRVEQLKAYIELMLNRFPLPLYVKLPDGSHKITRRLSDNMQVEGIVTKGGIFLQQPIHPSVFAKRGTTAFDLFLAAQKVHPDARPLIRDDIFGYEGSDTLVDLLDTESKMSLTFDMLSQKDIQFWPTFPQFAYLENDSSLSGTHMILYNLAGVCDELAFSLIDTVYLFVPKEKVDAQSLISEQEKSAELGAEENAQKVMSLLPTEEERFPLALFVVDKDGKERITNTIPEGYTVEGVALRDVIILRQTIKPCKINKENPTVDDLFALAKEVHPMAEPIYWKGFWGGGLVTLLLVDRKRYNQTAEILRKYNVIMPDINREISFVGAAPKVANTPNDRVSHLYFNQWIGSGRIKTVKEMILMIPREKVDPLY